MLTPLDYSYKMCMHLDLTNANTPTLFVLDVLATNPTNANTPVLFIQKVLCKVRIDASR